jgi:hypothetical protein
MRLLVMAVIGVGIAGEARGQAHPPITDRDYGIDLYAGAALGSVRIIGMGGTSLAVADGSAGALTNPAAAAVRATTSQGSWDWDFHVDALAAVIASDVDNTGVTAQDAFASRLETVGLAAMLRGWGVAMTGTTATHRLPGAAGESLEARALSTKLAVARESAAQVWTVGVALRAGTFEVARAPAGDPLFSITGAGLEVGGLWRPAGRDWRVGVALAFPVSGRQPAVVGCDPASCHGYVLPARIEVPWQVAAGVAWRWAPTRWNQRMPVRYRDEPALLLAADLLVTGAVPDAYGLEGFGAQVLQPSGRAVVLGARAGAEYEWLPGRLRLRGGTYWEPGRFAGVAGRLHGTVGVEVAVVHVRVWRWTHRLRVAATGDIAARYGNAGLSLGLWQ